MFGCAFLTHATILRGMFIRAVTPWRLFRERDNETKLDRLAHPHTFSWYGLGAGRTTEG